MRFKRHFVHFTSTIIAICLSFHSFSLADTIPILFGKSTGDAPFEQVDILEVSPFDPDARLLDISVLGITMGDCIIVECGGKRMLIDGGESNRFRLLDNYCNARGIDSFDIVYLTHCHDDHTGVQKRLIKAGYHVGLFISPYSQKDTYNGWTEVLQVLQKWNIPLQKMDDGDTYEFGGAKFSFFHRKASDPNAHSLVSLLSFGEAKVMLTGDINGYTQHWLLDNYPPETFKCDIYKVAHHGETQTVTEFLDAMSPGVAVITYPKGYVDSADKQLNRRDIPRYYISQGTIRLQTDGNQWYVWQEPLLQEEK